MNISEATAVYAEYLSGLPFAREFFDEETLNEYKEDMAKAHAEMERAWLESAVSKEAPVGQGNELPSSGD